MKKNILLILYTIFITVSCASTQILQKPVSNNMIDVDFRPYVENFITLSNGMVTEDDINTIEMTFDNLDGDVVGVCFPLFWDKKIQINKDSWHRCDKQIVREQILFHELGHCLLMRMHTAEIECDEFICFIENLFVRMQLIKRKGYLDDGCPISYMHPRVLSQKCIKKHYDYYIRELFDNITNTQVAPETKTKKYRYDY